MKKLSRIQKTKVIENVKTTVLVLLFLVAFFLGYRIFEIYHDQTSSNNNWWGSYSPVTTGTYEDMPGQNEEDIFETLWSPEIIMTCGANGRNIVSNGTDEFKDISSAVGVLIKDAFYITDGSRISQTDDTEWKKALKSDSVYISYPAERFTVYDEALYGASDSELSKAIKSYTNMLITFEKNDEKSATVFIPENFSEKTIKVMVQSDAAKGIRSIAEKYQKDHKPYAFAHELNLDTQSGDKAVLDSMLLIPIEEIETDDIVVDVPKIYKAGLNFTKTTDFMAGLINIFGYNPNTVRQYVNSDDALIFVGETGSLSISPEGKIEYKALGTNEGIQLKRTGATELYDINKVIYEIMEEIFNLCGISMTDCDFEIKISQLPSVLEKKQEMAFDYFVDGKKIEFSNIPAVYAVVENGVLTEIKMQINDIEKMNTKTAAPDVFEAIDKFCKDNRDVDKINEANLVYKYMGNGAEIKAEWSIQGE